MTRCISCSSQALAVNYLRFRKFYEMVLKKNDVKLLEGIISQIPQISSTDINKSNFRKREKIEKRLNRNVTLPDEY
ncbi:hypothetical protein [Okeania sp. SIO2B3]|uniref:hypothetical protein n=1 Tax=Okeania sp. SIO2B3 TaxID=2607784 RepID=UPI0025CC0AEE|nr:hypothetical protein [Okeania sp. SIO2B3]